MFRECLRARSYVILQEAAELLKESVGTHNSKSLLAQAKAADAAILDRIVDALREPETDEEWGYLKAEEITEPLPTPTEPTE